MTSQCKHNLYFYSNFGFGFLGLLNRHSNLNDASDMVKSKRREIIYKSLPGDALEINVRRCDTCLEIYVRKKDFSFKRQFIFFVMILALNCLSVLLRMLCTVGNIAIFVVTSAFMYKLFRTIFEEHLVIIKNLGYQISNNCALGDTTTFIPYEKVQRIFINEVILRHKVIYLLTLLTKDKDGTETLVPLFRNSLPRLQGLQLIYKHLKILESNSLP